MGRRALFPFRFYGALRRLKHLGILREIDDCAPKIFLTQVSPFWGAQVAIQIRFTKNVVGKLPTTAGWQPALQKKLSHRER
jgi:hypothetical protein